MVLAHVSSAQCSDIALFEKNIFHGKKNEVSIGFLILVIFFSVI